MQCCGDAFRVGGPVDWRLSPSTDHAWLTEIFGDTPHREPSHFYDHHSEEPPPPSQPGVVTSITAVHCTYRKSGQALTPVAGSAVLSARATADGWEDEDDEGGSSDTSSNSASPRHSCRSVWRSAARSEMLER
jgi:hypothetical protein